MNTQRHSGAGLCMNCVHGSHCVFERASATAVLQCDEHVVRTTTSNVARTAKEPRSFYVPTGLCTTCDHVNGCGLRSPERIVLHCEHYE